MGDSVGSSRRSSAHSMPDVDRCGLEEEQVKSLKRTFDQFDKEKQGAISVGTVETILKMMGMHVSSKDLEDIIQEIDEDGSGELEFPEFIQLAAKFLIEEDEEEVKWELKEAFRLYDKQGNGYITTNTLKEILREIDSNLTEYNLDQIVDEVDEDGSGTIDFDEFMAMMTGMTKEEPPPPWIPNQFSPNEISTRLGCSKMLNLLNYRSQALYVVWFEKTLFDCSTNPCKG